MRLHAMLKKLDEDEAERLRLLKLWEDQNTDYEHFADGDVDINAISEEHLEEKCQELFTTRPIEFVPVKGEDYELHKDLEKLIIEHNITIPVIHIKGSVYLIGDKKHIIQQNTNSFTVRVGGGHFKFEEYVPNNHKYFEKALLIHMIKSKESLEWVCEALMNEQRIPQAAAGYEDPKDHVVEIARRLPTRSNDENRSPNKAGEQS